MKKNKLEFFKSKIFWMILLLVVLILVQINELTGGMFTSVEVDLQDACGVTVNEHVQHTIADSSICHAECMNYCWTIEMEYKNSKFTASDLGCHSCKCSCK